MMTDIGRGDVIRYSYLWSREHARGEVSGRKTRPACVMLVVAAEDGKQNTLIFPITSQLPASGVAAVEVPETEARRAKLFRPAWIIINELNRDDLTASYELEDSKPLGQFSKKFMLKLAVEVRGVLRARKMIIASRN
jgi:hypothetical protein